MSILVNKDSKVVVQGITGSAGSFHSEQMQEYGTNIVCGVTPGKGGATHLNVPVYDTVFEAVSNEGANTSVIFVPPRFAAEAIMEAADAGIKVAVCITEGIPVHDMMEVKNFIAGKDFTLVGPNCPGIITPGECKLGIMPGYIHKKGHTGVISRSGTLTYEAVWQLSSLNIGQSTCVGIGGDQIIGSPFIDILNLFQNDPDTDSIVMIGEIGGSMEEDAAEFIKNNVTKPVVSFIAGQTAPKGKRMGHAGAIISGGSGKAEDKIQTLMNCGVKIAKNPAEIGKTLASSLS